MMTKLPKYMWNGAVNGRIKLCQQNTISDIAYRRAYHIPDFIFYIKSMKEALITMITVPFALIGDFMVYFMGLIYLWPLQSGLSHFWDG
jgi:Cu(I)/Ag(I) efflux system membrane protein CusA/SilA